MHRYLDADIDTTPLAGKTIGILGYGNQACPQALNLKDGGYSVVIGLRTESHHRETAERSGFSVLDIPEAVKESDILMLLVPDDQCGRVYDAHIRTSGKTGLAVGFAHGLCLQAGWLKPDPRHDIFLVAPKGQGRGVRQKFQDGSGVPGLVAVHQDVSGNTEALAMAYAKAIGCARTGVFQTSVSEETISDLFSEQTVLCGGLTRLIRTAYETLIEAGFSAPVAYFECLYEVKLIADLIHEKGIAGMREGISSAALFGDIHEGDRVIDGHVRENMRQTLARIQSGEFFQAFQAEIDRGFPEVRETMLKDRAHSIEQAHQLLH